MSKEIRQIADVARTAVESGVTAQPVHNEDVDAPVVSGRSRRGVSGRGRRIVAGTVLAAGLTMVVDAATTTSSAAADTGSKPGVVVLDQAPQPTDMLVNLASLQTPVVVEVPQAAHVVEAVPQNVPAIVDVPNTDGDPELTDLYEVDHGDTMNKIAGESLDDAGIEDPSKKQIKVQRAVNEAANPQVTDRTKIYDNRTRLNLTEKTVTEVIAEAAEGRGDAALVEAVEEVLAADTLDKARAEAVDVLEEVGITPTRAEDIPRGQDVGNNDDKASEPALPALPPVPDVEITADEVDAAVTSGEVVEETLPKGSNLWNETENVLEGALDSYPLIPEVNPASRIEQVLNLAVDEDIDFRAMDVGAEYVSLNDASTLIIGAAANIDAGALQKSTVPQEVQEDIRHIQELNNQPDIPEGKTSKIDKYATEIVMNWNTGIIPQDVLTELANVMRESDPEVKQQKLAEVLNNPVVLKALNTPIVPPVDPDPPFEQGDEGYVDPNQDPDPPFEQGDEGYVDPNQDPDPPFEQGDEGYVDPNQDPDPPFEQGDEGYVDPNQDPDPPFEQGDEGYVDPNEDQGSGTPQWLEDFQKWGIENAGIVIGSVAGAAILGGAAVTVARRRRRGRTPEAGNNLPTTSHAEMIALDDTEREAVVDRLIAAPPYTTRADEDEYLRTHPGADLPYLFETKFVDEVEQVLTDLRDKGEAVDVDKLKDALDAKIARITPQPAQPDTRIISGIVKKDNNEGTGAADVVYGVYAYVMSTVRPTPAP